MRNGEHPISPPSRRRRLCSAGAPKPPPPSSRLSHLLLVASISKTLLSRHNNTSKPLTLPPNIPLSDTVLLSLLRRRHLLPSLKIRLFHLSFPFFTPSPTSFSVLLRSISPLHPHSILSVIRLHLSLHRHHPLPASTLRLAFSSLLRFRLFDHAFLLLDSLPHPIPSSLHSALLLSLLRASHLPLALSVLRNLLHTPSNPPDPRVCISVLTALRRAGLRLEFRQLFDELRQRGFPFNTHLYNVCINAFGSWGDLPAAFGLFMEMKGNPASTPDLCTHNSLVKSLCLVGKIDDAMKVYEELKLSGYTPDVFTYRTLVHACCIAYRIEDACMVFEEMEVGNVQVDAVVYNCLLDGLFKARKLKEACGLFERMVMVGVRPSNYSYNILIDGLFRNDRREAAFTLFCDLKKKGQNVDGVTYSIMVVQLCKEGQVEEALRLVEEMEARRFTVDLVTVTAVLIALHRSQQWDRAERLMKCVRHSSLVSNVVRWTSDMEAMLKAPQDGGKDFTPMFPSTGGFSDVMSWVNPSTGSSQDDLDNLETTSPDEWSLTPYLDQLAQKSRFWASSPMFSTSKGRRVHEKNGNGKFFDINMMNTYLSIFLKERKLSMACKLFEIFTAMGHQPVSYSFNSLLTSFIKKGYFKVAWGALQKMDQDMCSADIATYNIIIQGLGKSGNTNLASAVMNQLLKKGGYLDIVMYNTLIHVLGKGGIFEEANKLFKEMLKSGINPDVVTFNTLIEVHAKAGRVEDAYQFLKMMLDHGCSPNYVTDTVLEFLEKEVEKLRYRRASIKHEED